MATSDENKKCVQFQVCGRVQSFPVGTKWTCSYSWSNTNINLNAKKLHSDSVQLYSLNLKIKGFLAIFSSEMNCNFKLSMQKEAFYWLNFLLLDEQRLAGSQLSKPIIQTRPLCHFLFREIINILHSAILFRNLRQHWQVTLQHLFWISAHKRCGSPLELNGWKQSPTWLLRVEQCIVLLAQKSLCVL